MTKTRATKVLTMVIALILALGLLLSIGAGVLYTFATTDLERQLNEKLEGLKGQLSALDGEKADLDNKRTEIQTNKDEVASQISDIEGQLNVLADRQSGLMDEKVNLDMQMNVTMEQISVSQQIIDELTLQIAQRTRDLLDAEQKEAEEYELFKTRIRAMSESESVTELQMIFSASSLTDVYVRLEAMADIARYDRNLMARLAEVREYIAGLKAELEADQQAEREAQEKLVAYEAELALQTENVNTLLVRLDTKTNESVMALTEAENLEDLFELELQASLAEIAAKEAEIAAQQAEIDKTKDAIKAEQKAEAARKAAEAAKKAAEEAAKKAKADAVKKAQEDAAKTAAAASSASSSSSSSSSGKITSMTWPCPSSSNVTSKYGMRTHPITGVYKLHNGIDIAAAKNAKIVAAAAGTVTTVTYSNAYGNYVIITHSGGIQTLYAHMTTATVSEGQTVSAGEQIGKVGMTGYSTGYHLHFTVLVNGSSVDPMKYLG
ncbi:MAG: peptidoglycan DD-metalloendopeptidase family protein [Clostridiaceae bacterium]|nr:peptidoglycan DD-metalloendopeptidase family protein [Clostridiaceae bacterium]